MPYLGRPAEPQEHGVTAALMFLFGVAFGALLNALWTDVLDLFDIYRDER